MEVFFFTLYFIFIFQSWWQRGWRGGGRREDFGKKCIINNTCPNLTHSTNKGTTPSLSMSENPLPEMGEGKGVWIIFWSFRYFKKDKLIFNTNKN